MMYAKACCRQLSESVKETAHRVVQSDALREGCMFLRLLPLLVLFLLSQASPTQQLAAGRPHTVPKTCPVTSPSDQPFVPPPPYPPNAPKGSFWFGTDQLWTLLPNDGIWGLPYHDATFGQKLFFWRQGYDWGNEPQPPLILTGRRLNATAPPLIGDPASNGYREDWKSFMVTGVNLPTVGCWEVTGHDQGHGLTFVVWVTN